MKNETAITRLRILVADDDYKECRRLEDMLTELGAEVETASNGLVVIGLVRNTAFDLVLMNSDMPVMDGAKTARILQADPRFRTLPLVCMTDKNDALEQKRLRGLGFAKILQKPVLQDVLAAEVTNLPPRAPSRQAFTGMRVFVSNHSENAGLATEEITPKGLTPVRLAGEAIPPPAPGAGQASSPAKAPAQSNAGSEQPAAKAASPAIPDLDGFDIPQGISRLMGNRALYLRLLGDFAQSLQSCVEDVRQAENANDLPALLAVIHKIKGMSGNVAATRLYEYIVDLEKRLKAEPDTARKEPLRMVYPLMEATIATLAAVRPQQRPPAHALNVTEAETDNAPPGPLDPALENALQETLCAVEKYATSSRDSFESVCVLLGTRHDASQEAISDRLESFDFEGAKEELLKLTCSLGVARITKYEQ